MTNIKCEFDEDQYTNDFPCSVNFSNETIDTKDGPLAMNDVHNFVNVKKESTDHYGNDCANYVNFSAETAIAPMDNSSTLNDFHISSNFKNASENDVNYSHYLNRSEDSENVKAMEMDSDMCTTPLLPEKEFILNFEMLPELWDTTNVHYSNKLKRMEALHKLLLIHKKIKVDANIGDVRKKINSLRSNYRREFKKQLISIRTCSEIYTPKSWTFQYLGFLSTTGQPIEDTLSTELMEAEDSEDSEKQNLNFSNKTTSSFSYAKQVSKPLKVTTVKKKESGHLANKKESLDQTCSFKPQPISFNSLILVWIKKLEKLDYTQRLFAEKAINDILFEAELGNLHRYSVKINQPATSKR